MSEDPGLIYKPIGPDSWADLAVLFGERGARGGCWCMRWRLPRLQFEQQKGSRNRRTFKAGVEQGKIRGIIGYAGGIPVAWCSVGLRTEFVGLQASELLAPVDEKDVWSIACFFIQKKFRLQHVSIGLLEAAVNYIQTLGGEIVEGYPLVPIKEKIPVAFAWTGFESVFKSVGFVEVERRVEIRPIMRYYFPEK